MLVAFYKKYQQASKCLQRKQYFWEIKINQCSRERYCYERLLSTSSFTELLGGKANEFVKFWPLCNWHNSENLMKNGLWKGL